MPETYYHVYNRGVEKRDVFLDEHDYGVFLHLFKRYLGGVDNMNSSRHPYEDLSESLDLLAYCLLPNHFHLLLYQYNATAITQLMRRVSTGYCMYFNKKYGRVGSLFQERYLATNISNEAHLLHISRYIHLNSLDLGMSAAEYAYSSYPYYMRTKSATWIKPDKILALFQDASYHDFVEDYNDYKQSLNLIHDELADTKYD